ncbi:hypothetical protein LZ30DRAFT_195450 [Colletotrichum cereale]|nr:hypothetical protein LZ30DRAFT_195450 [Colletotrichum cereale]
MCRGPRAELCTAQQRIHMPIIPQYEYRRVGYGWMYLGALRAGQQGRWDTRGAPVPIRLGVAEGPRCPSNTSPAVGKGSRHGLGNLHGHDARRPQRATRETESESRRVESSNSAPAPPPLSSVDRGQAANPGRTAPVASLCEMKKGDGSSSANQSLAKDRGRLLGAITADREAKRL